MTEPVPELAATRIESSGVHDLLAHRYPFLLVDRIHIQIPGRRVVGTKLVSAGEWWAVQGPRTTMPFGLVVEALAQTSGALLRDLLDGTRGGIAYFMGVDRARLRQPARPGDELRLEVTLRQWRRGICRTSGRATVGGALVVAAELSTIVRGAT